MGVAAVMTEGEEGRCVGARIVLSGVGSVPVRASEAEEILKAGPLDADRIREAGEATKRNLDPRQTSRQTLNTVSTCQAFTWGERPPPRGSARIRGLWSSQSRP